MTSGTLLVETVHFQQIDQSNIGDHYYLEATDVCLFLREYTSGKDYSFSATNNLISNLKKKPSRLGMPDYHYKLQAISQCAAWLGPSFNPAWLHGATLVPVPPSKPKGDPEYDDRILKICQSISVEFPLDIRELVVQRQALRAAHESAGNRPTIDEIVANYDIDETKTTPIPSRVAIVDDVLTAGTHFKAMQHVLIHRFPSIIIVGVFIARRVLPNSKPELLFDVTDNNT